MQEKRISDDLVRQRVFLIRLAKKVGVVGACSRLGKHRSYYYYWKARYDEFGWKGLVNQSRRPKHMPRLTCKKKVRAIVRVRKKTGYGKERIHDELVRRYGLVIPISTIGKILAREGLLVKKRRFKTQKKHTRLYNLLYPGQRVQMDIKYVPSELCPFGRRYYQYTVIDECTRMRYLAWYDSIWVKRVVEVLKRAQRFFGFKIDTIQTDNGNEFTYYYTSQIRAVNKEPKEHPLDVYCREKGIVHKLIPPGEKEINGKVERSHRADMEEFYRTILRVKNIDELRWRGRSWINFYNFQRRHSGIGKMTPAHFAIQRLKKYPERITVNKGV